MACTRSWVACWVRYGLIFLMFSNEKRHERATEVTWSLKVSWNFASSEGEPAPKKTPEERTSAGGIAAASDLCSDPNHLDPQTGSVSGCNVTKQPKDKFQANWLRLCLWLEHNNGEMNGSICKLYGAVPFTNWCYKTSTLRLHSDAVSHTAAVKRKQEADSAKHVMVKAIEEGQLKCEEETKGLLKTTYFISEN